MRNWLLLGLLASLALAGGCATVTKTGPENMATFKRNVEFEARQIADDWNLIWMADRQCRLTRWQTR